jgi:high-affinity iron transporter
VSSVLGTILSGVFNYDEAPTIGEAVVYAVFLAVTLFLFLRPATTYARKVPSATSVGG